VSFLIDTNVISEVRKASRCNANVWAWYGSIEDIDLYLSVLVLGEIRKSIEQARRRDPRKAGALEAWLIEVDAAFGERVLPIDRAVTDEWGRMSAVRSIPVIDGLLAATARVHRLTFVTRNDADVAGLGAEVLNPFTPPAPNTRQRH
jgi:predicted nucleic acid-binding protein